MYLSSEGNHMMLAKREDIDIFHNNELAVIFIEDCPIDQILNIFRISFGKI